MRLPLIASLLAGWLCAGCATTLSNHQTAKPVAPGHVQIGGGAGLYVPLGSVGSAIGAGITQARKAADAAANHQQYTVSQADQQDLLTAGIALAVLPPSTAFEVSIRTGLFENMDVGLRYSVNAVRLDTKFRFFHMDDGPDVPPDSQRSFDVALGLGGSRYLFNNPVIDALEYVQLGDFSRWDLEVPLTVSYEIGEIARFYGGLRYLYSRTSMDEKLVNTSEQASNITGLDLTLPEVVHMHFIGATAGVMVGYKYVFLILELTGGYTICNPIIFGEHRNLGGVTLYPSAGLALRF